MNDFKLALGEPVIVARSAEASPSEKLPWGVYQFPCLERSPDGALFVTFSVYRDSEDSYGRTKGYRLSTDGGESWREVSENLTRGVETRDGGRLRLIELLARKGVDIPLPEPDPALNLGGELQLYHDCEFSDAQNAYPFEKKASGGEWKLEMKEIKLPERACRYLVYSTGLFPYNMLWYLKKAPGGTLWGIAYEYFEPGYNGRARSEAFFVTSEDGGETFSFRSSIPYQPDPAVDPSYNERAGFTEPNLAFLPSGRILCLLRTDGPMYVCYSDDDGYTWTRPKFFDDLGVWPALATLGCGVTIAAYGRPGVFVRATDDPAGELWRPRTALADIDLSLPAWRTSCSYTSIAALDETSAIVVYSDFNYPGPDGLPHKTILARKITIE